MARSPILTELRRRFELPPEATEPSSQDRDDRARDARSWRDAAERYCDHLAQAPYDQPIWLQLGHLLNEDGHLEEARKAYQEALALDPDDAETLLHLAHLLRRTGDMGQAARMFRTSFERDGNADAARELSRPEIRAHLDAADPL